LIKLIELVFQAPDIENVVILVCIVLLIYSYYGQTDTLQWLRRAIAVPAVARKNLLTSSLLCKQRQTRLYQVYNVHRVRQKKTSPTLPIVTSTKITRF